MRVQVRVAEIFSGIPDKYLPWATYQLPLGSRPGNGGIIPVQVGDIVWVRFDSKRQPPADHRRGGLIHAGREAQSAR